MNLSGRERDRHTDTHAHTANPGTHTYTVQLPVEIAAPIFTEKIGNSYLLTTLLKFDMGKEI